MSDTGRCRRNVGLLPREEDLVEMYRRCCLLLVVCLAVVATLLSGCMPTLPECGQDVAALRSCGNRSTRHCTIFTVSRGGRVFFAGNDDYTNRDSYYWVDPGGDATGYGAVYFGEPDNVQQGFNEKGLAYDANGLPQAPVMPHPERKPVHGGYTSYPIEILRACATVEEVIAWVREHQWHTAMHDQLHFADATGDAVVLSSGSDGELALTRKAIGDTFLISTNFNVANPSNGSYPCWRYTQAERMLGQIKSDDEFTAERITSILDAVHLETPNNWTLYSVVADLPERILYVYFWFQYDAPIVLNVDEEIARAPAPEPLSALFPAERRSQANREYQRLVGYTVLCNAAIISWSVAVGACLVALIIFSRSQRRFLFFWIPVVALLGPVALIVWLVAARGSPPGADGASKAPTLVAEPKPWQRALVETTGDLAPYAPTTVAVMLLAALVPGLSQNGTWLVVVIYGLPLAVGLLLFQGPLLARATKTGYLCTVRIRLPAALVSTSLALSGILPVAMPLIIWAAQYCSVKFVIVLAWAIAVQGALVGGLLLYVYHSWAVRRGFIAWSTLLWGTGEVGDNTLAASYPSWRRLWSWILLSSAILLGGMTLTVLLLRLAQA